MRLQGQALRKQEVSYVSTSHGQVIQLLCFLALLLQLDILKMRVHGHVDARDGAIDDTAILKLDADGLAAQLHQEFNQLHYLFNL